MQFFKFEEFFLQLETSGITPQVSVRANNSMAWDYNGKEIFAIG
jgi:hypothetical protein